MSFEDQLVCKRYLVIGRRRYRNHEPGTVFEAKLWPDAERRAVERKSLRVLGVVDPSLESGSYRLPTNGDPVSTKYDPDKSPLTAIREADDAEFPNDQPHTAEVPNRDAVSGSRAH